jgi:predicted nucleic acid-binding Zn ribbon protein
MPLYHWKCKKCEADVEVLRNFDDYQVEPGLEDDKLEDSECEHEWSRHIGTGIQVQYAGYWPGKGNH